MRSSGGKRLNHPKKVLCCHVTFLDDAVATYEIPKDAKGSVLFQSVIRSLELNSESSYFGLLFTDNDKFNIWLDLEKKIKSQIKSDEGYKFEFRVKFYVSEPGAMLMDELTRYQFVLQLKQDLYQQRLSCTFRTLALLASYIVQSELGDYDPSIHKSGYLREFKFVPNQPADLEAEIIDLHKMHTGLTPEEVEIRYLEKAKWLTAYGVDMRKVRDSHGLPLKLGIAPGGIQVYRAGDTVQNTFDWPRITKLRFHQKKFYVKVQGKEPGAKEIEHCFTVDKTKHCKLLWKVCLEHHGFYKSLPPVDRTATLLRAATEKSHRSGSRTRTTTRTDSFRGGDTAQQRTPRATRPEHTTTPHRTPRSEITTAHRTPRPEPTPTHRTPRPEPTTPTRRREHDAYAGYNGTRSHPTPRPDYNYYNSLPRKRHDYTDHYDSNRYDKQAHHYENGSSTLNKRSKSIGAGDVLDLDYPVRSTQRDYYASGDFKNFFTDTVLQNKVQYSANYGKSWANNMYSAPARPGSKSTPDVRLAASQPAFMTSSAMRQANFLMTTEL